LKRQSRLESEVPLPVFSKQEMASRRRRARQLDALQAKLGPKLPQIDPHDLRLILMCLLRPFAEKRFFIQKKGDHYSF
jgi:hypothetical protein